MFSLSVYRTPMERRAEWYFPFSLLFNCNYMHERRKLRLVLCSIISMHIFDSLSLSFSPLQFLSPHCVPPAFTQSLLFYAVHLHFPQFQISSHNIMQFSESKPDHPKSANDCVHVCVCVLIEFYFGLCFWQSIWNRRIVATFCRQETGGGEGAVFVFYQVSVPYLRFVFREFKCTTELKWEKREETGKQEDRWEKGARQY